MTCTPDITVLKSSLATRTGGLFQASTATVTLVVNYCGQCTGEGEAPPDTPFQVLEDVNGTYWDIVVGRPLAEIDAQGNRTAWLQAYSADMTQGEVMDVNSETIPYAYYYVKDYSCRQMPSGNPGLWEITVNVAMMKIDNSEQFPHCSVDVQTGSRMASAWRLGPGGSTDIFKVPTTNTSGTGPSMGTIADGYWEPKNWRGQVAAYQDVNGFDVDENGNPVSVAVEQIRYVISFVVRRPYLEFIPVTGASTFKTNESYVEFVTNAQCYVNKRNDTEMFGFPPGSLLCESINVSAIDEQFSKVSLTLVWDEWGHFDQNIWAEGGNVGGLSDQWYSTTGTIDRVMTTAFAVFWTTSYHEAFRVASMSDLMPQAVWSVAEAAITAPVCYYPAGTGFGEGGGG